MASKQFLVSVADVWAYDDDDNLLFTAKTMLDSSFDFKTAVTDIRGGRGAPIQYIYSHSPDLTLTMTDTQWNLGFIAAALGQSVGTSTKVYTEETVTLTAGLTGTITGTPLAIQGTALYGWVTHNTGTHAGLTEQVVFSTKTFTSAWGVSGEVVCVRYYAVNANADYVTVYANNVPSIIRLVLDTQVAETSDTSFTSSIGTAEIIIPRGKLTGNFTISMKADGVSTTPLNVRALASPNPDTTAGCSNQDILAKIAVIITGAHWYDDVVALGVSGGNFPLAVGATQTIDIVAVRSNGTTFRPPYADLTFATSAGTTASISVAGLVTGLSVTGDSTLKATITAVSDITASCVVSVS
jgi:hypothetical protein